MSDRGFLAPGMAADIAVFDPATVIDRATYAEPTLASVGIRHVIVNGRLALRDGTPTGAQSGRVLVRAANMPSRPMRTAESRSLSVQTPKIAIDLSQNGYQSAQGKFAVHDPAAKLDLDISEPGLLQVSGQWAAFTARAGDRTFFAIVDAGNPLDPQASIHIAVDDGRLYDAHLDPGSYRVR
jgi:hypothetical protein